MSRSIWTTGNEHGRYRHKRSAPLANPNDERHAQAVNLLTRLRSQGARLVVVPQVFAEFWVVATRPVEGNGLGASPIEVDAEISRLLGFFELVSEPIDAFAAWRELVAKTPVVGRRAHDARLAAAYATIGCNQLLTFNPRDFVGLQESLGFILVPIDS